MSRWFGCLAALLFVGVCGGCGASGSYHLDREQVASSQSTGFYDFAEDVAVPMDAPGAMGGVGGAPALESAAGDPAGLVAVDKSAPDGSQQAVETQRVILYSADMGLYVFDFQKTLELAVEHTKAAGGYMQSSTNNSVTLRVPAEGFEALMDKLDALGDIHYRNVTGTDVTEEFLDLSIRLKNAEVLRERFAALLAQAKSVEDSLAIEKELARVTGEIERMKGRLRYLKDRAAFSVVNLRLEPKTSEQVVVDRIPLPFGWLRQYGLGEVLQ